MKIRSGFISNSSSSSFIIMLKDVTATQLRQIVLHGELGKLYDIPYGDTDPWQIGFTEETVHGYTVMDNFDMREFLSKIGVPEEVISIDRDA